MTVMHSSSPTGRKFAASPAMQRAWFASLALSFVLLLLPFVLKLDGKPHADWQQFLGRFHPLAVHFPIALLILVPLLEIAGAFRPALREAAGFVLGLGFASCLGALALGYLLAYGSGESGPAVTRHMWGGICLSLGALICLLLRPAWFDRSNGSSAIVLRLYPAALAGLLILLAWTAHQGGSLTHGADYLTKYMPAPLKHLASAGSATTDAQAEGSFYAKHIHPILDANCVACHGESKTMGGLRVDSYDLLMRGGKDGAVILAGHSETSLLLQRITLPPSHKLFMPSEGRPPLKAEEISWIKAWIAQGASPTATKLAGVSVPDEVREQPLQPVGDYSAMMPEIRQMQATLAAKLLPVSNQPSDGLILSTADAPSSFGDAQLAQFLKFAPFIVEAELGRTAVTDASFATLGKFTHLRALHLEQTTIAGNGLDQLSSLKQLTYLNLSETKVTAATVASLKASGNLRIYLYNTPAQPETAADATQPVARKEP
jgi:uncharacterized membrane protein